MPLFIPTPPWMRDPRVRCKTQTALFYPSERPGQQVARAKKICNGVPGTRTQPAQEPCVFRDMCLHYAIDQQEVFGVWGGTSERERRKIQRARRNNSNPTIYTMVGVRFPKLVRVKRHKRSTVKRWKQKPSEEYQKVA
jgi:hypothetical protein